MLAALKSTQTYRSWTGFTTSMASAAQQRHNTHEEGYGNKPA